VNVTTATIAASKADLTTVQPPLVKPLTSTTTAKSPVSTTAAVPPSLAPEIKTQNGTISNRDDESMIEWQDVDVQDEDRNKTLIQNNITSIEEDHHDYYNSTVIQNESHTNLHRQFFYADCTNLTINKLLSKSHRRAMTVKLPFEFPFYGHPIQNITIATGGFLYAGDYIHSWLAATQYISPLMANFDTSISNDSYVKYCEDGKLLDCRFA